MLAARSEWLQHRPDLARRMVDAHRELTRWVVAHPSESRTMVKDELEKLTTAESVEAGKGLGFRAAAQVVGAVYPCCDSAALAAG